MNTMHHQQFVNPLEDYDYTDSELVIGFVCAVGADYGPIRDTVQEILKQFSYEVNIFRVSDLITAFSDRNLPDSPEFDRISSRMNEGNIGCSDSGRNDLWALAAIAQINETRKRNEAKQ